MAFDFNFGSVLPSNPLAGVRPFQAGDLPFRAQALQGIQPISSVPSDYYSSIYNAALKPAEARLSILQQQGQQQAASVGEIFKGLQGYINSQTARQDAANADAKKQAAEDKKAAEEAPLKALELQKAQLQIEEIKNRMKGTTDPSWQKFPGTSDMTPPSGNSTQGMDTTSPAPDAATNPYAPGGAADQPDKPLTYDKSSPEDTGDPWAGGDRVPGYLFKNAPQVPSYLKNTPPPSASLTPPKSGVTMGSVSTTPPTDQTPLKDIMGSLKASLQPNFVTTPTPAMEMTPPAVPAGTSTPAVDSNAIQQSVTDQMQKMSNLPTSELSGYLSASTGAPMTPALPVDQTAQQPSFQDFAQYSLQNMQAPPTPQQASPQPTPQAAVQGQPPQQGAAASNFQVPQRPTGEQLVKPLATKDYNQALQEQMADHGPYYEPTGHIQTMHDPQTGEQWYMVTREPEKSSVIEQKLARMQQASERSDKLDVQRQRVINQERQGFSQDPNIKNYVGPNGMRQAAARFVRDYQAATDTPGATATADIGIMDMYGRAEGGGKITEGQQELLNKAASLKDRAAVWGIKLEGNNEFLSPAQRNMMLRVINDDQEAQVNIANSSINMMRKSLIKQGITDEDLLPQPYIAPILREPTKAAVDNAAAQARALSIQADQAKNAGDVEKFNALTKQIAQIMYNVKDKKELLDSAPPNQQVLNLYDVEHKPQGWVGAGITTLVPEQ